MSSRRRIVAATLMVIVILIAAGCDQGTKAIARSCLGDGTRVSLFGGILVMHYVENPGAFLSLGAWLPIPVRRTVFVAIPLVILTGVVLYVVSKKTIRLLLAFGLCCIAGGGAGNLLDRVMHDGRVGDFLNVGFGALRTGIFNVADLCVMVGCLVLVIDASHKTS